MFYWTALYHLKYFIPKSALKSVLHFPRTTTNLINMITCVNFLLIRMKKQGSECTPIIHYWKKYLRNTLKFADTADEFIKLFTCNYFYICVCVRVCIFLCLYLCIYVYFMWVIHVQLHVYMLQCICLYKRYENLFC